MFQHITFRKDDIGKLLRTINGAAGSPGDRHISEEGLTQLFETMWPKLESDLRTISCEVSEKTPVRTDRDILEEILEILRSQGRREPLTDDSESIEDHA